MKQGKFIHGKTEVEEGGSGTKKASPELGHVLNVPLASALILASTAGVGAGTSWQTPPTELCCALLGGARESSPRLCWTSPFLPFPFEGNILVRRANMKLLTGNIGRESPVQPGGPENASAEPSWSLLSSASGPGASLPFQL